MDAVGLAGFALMKMLACVGSFCGPFLIGALSDANKGSFVPALLLLSGLLLLASIMNLFFKEPGERSLCPVCCIFSLRVCDRMQSVCHAMTKCVSVCLSGCWRSAFYADDTRFPCTCLLRSQKDDNERPFKLLQNTCKVLAACTGSSQSFLPRFPYSCGALMKRSRSDPSTITLSPTLCHILGTRSVSLSTASHSISHSDLLGVLRYLHRGAPLQTLQASTVLADCVNVGLCTLHAEKTPSRTGLAGQKHLKACLSSRCSSGGGQTWPLWRSALQVTCMGRTVLWEKHSQLPREGSVSFLPLYETHTGLRRILQAILKPHCVCAVKATLAKASFQAMVHWGNVVL